MHRKSRILLVLAISIIGMVTPSSAATMTSVEKVDIAYPFGLT